mmetsp:Transcript_7535/g.25508  ORF Transcript_7535/g.25508 Transcript_7535/m.25508 type:complete len:202 (-) Transcript_7535:1422-2027(-)
MLPRSPRSCTWPRRELRSPITSPMDSSGVIMSTFIMGSMRREPAPLRPWRVAMRPAISKASTDESTSWYWPSMRRALTPSTGKPATTPLESTLSMPFCTPGQYSLGMAPPLISDSNTKSASALSMGSSIIFTLANCPLPPLCFLCVYSTSKGLVMASRYATCGAPSLHSTLNSRLRRSTMISRCSSPMPSMTVWPVSSSRL